MGTYSLYFEDIEKLANARTGELGDKSIIVSLDPQGTVEDWKEQLDSERDLFFIKFENLKSIKGLPNHFLNKKLKQCGVWPSNYNEQAKFENHDFSKDLSVISSDKTYYLFEAPYKGPRLFSKTKMIKNEINSSQGKLILHLLGSQHSDLDWRKEFIEQKMFGEYTYIVHQSKRPPTETKLFPHHSKSFISEEPRNPINPNPTNSEEAKTSFSLWSKGISSKNGKVYLGKKDASELWEYVLKQHNTNEVLRTLQPLIVDFLSEVLNLEKRYIV
jgi:hypothetical protein